MLLVPNSIFCSALTYIPLQKINANKVPDIRKNVLALKCPNIKLGGQQITLNFLTNQKEEICNKLSNQRLHSVQTK